MPTRTARTGWTGTLQNGSGQVEMTSSGVGTYEVSFPSRTAEQAGGFTSPEELIAAAHSACYAMQLSALIGQAGGTPQALDVQADVSLGPDPAGGFRLTGIKLTVRGEVEGLDAAQFAKAAADAKASCPVSKALTGVDITLDAQLES
jgi:lipoyl-dependent peroxiredoxin